MIRTFARYYINSYRGLPSSAWMLSAIVFVNRSGSMVLFFLSLYLTTQLLMTIALAGTFISIYGIGSLAGALLGGWLTDRWGAARVQLYSLLFGGLSFIVISFLDNYVLVGFALFSAALLNDAFRPANISAFAQVCPPQLRARGFALNRMAINLGMAVGPALGGYLALIDYHLIFWVDGITCIGAGLLFQYLVIRRNLLPGDKVASTEKDKISPYRDHPFMLFIGILLLVGLVFTQVFNTWPLYLRHVYQLIEDRIGLLLTINAILITLFEMPLIRALEKQNHLQVMTIGAAFFLTGFIILPLGEGLAFAVFTVVLWTIGEIMVFPLSGSFVANRSTDSSRGKYMGMYAFGFGVSFVVGPTYGSWLYNLIGPDMMWFSMAIPGVLIIAGFLWLGKLTNQHH